jgi:hypothetical protein
VKGTGTGSERLKANVCIMEKGKVSDGKFGSCCRGIVRKANVSVLHSER